MLETAVTVKQLNFYVKSVLQSDKRLSYISVIGEISNFKNRYSSGHWYFTLKDNDASVNCVMFKSFTHNVGFEPSDGMRVIASGSVSLYEKDGSYQFYPDKMTAYGDGDLAYKYRLVKEKLEKEGLFDESTKRPINNNPKRIAVVTSESGAALHDILTTVSKRKAACEIIVCPVTVQGETAPKSIIETLDRIYALSGIDTVIIARGGGSFEDLACFNDEALARKIYESPVPVISGVGHETDFTICDFVADKRAATPTAAAVCATSDASELSDKVKDFEKILYSRIKNIYDKYEYRYKIVSNSRFIRNPLELVESKMQTADYLEKRLNQSFASTYTSYENRFKHCVDLLSSLSPLKTLQRGFAIAESNGTVIESAESVSVGDSLELRLKDGTLKCTVEEKTNG